MEEEDLALPLLVHLEVDLHTTEKGLEHIAVVEVDVAVKTVLKTLKSFVAVVTCVQMMAHSPGRESG